MGIAVAEAAVASGGYGVAMAGSAATAGAAIGGGIGGAGGFGLEAVRQGNSGDFNELNLIGASVTGAAIGAGAGYGIGSAMSAYASIGTKGGMTALQFWGGTAKDLGFAYMGTESGGDIATDKHYGWGDWQRYAYMGGGAAISIGAGKAAGFLGEWSQNAIWGAEEVPWGQRLLFASTVGRSAHSILSSTGNYVMSQGASDIVLEYPMGYENFSDPTKSYSTETDHVSRWKRRDWQLFGQEMWDITTYLLF